MTALAHLVCVTGMKVAVVGIGGLGHLALQVGYWWPPRAAGGRGTVFHGSWLAGWLAD